VQRRALHHNWMRWHITVSKMNSLQAGAPFDWTLMRSFLAVLEQGSLLAAARRLGSSQPTVGRHVAELERQLGMALFERTGRGLVPTQVALSIAGHARAMADNADAIGRILTGQSKQLAGAVRITAVQMVAGHVLPPILARLRVEEPGIAIEVVASNAISNLLRREADIAIRMVRPDQGSLITRHIADPTIGAYAHEDYLRRRGIPQIPADLLQHDLIGFDQFDLIIRRLQEIGLSIARDGFAIRSDDQLVLWEALRAGLGIGFAGVRMGDKEPGVRRVLPGLTFTMPIWLTVHREIRSSARIRAVYDFLAKAIPEALA